MTPLYIYLNVYKCISATKIVDINLEQRRMNTLERLTLLITIPLEDYDQRYKCFSISEYLFPSGQRGKCHHVGFVNGFSEASQP